MPKKITYCGICGQKQFETDSGITCPDGHGGAPSLNSKPGINPNTMGTYKSSRLSATEVANKPKLWSKLYRAPVKKLDVSIDSLLSSELDLLIWRRNGYWFITIFNNITNCIIIQSGDGQPTFKEAFQDAVNKIPKH